jgi:hypothetical protein
MHPALRSWRNDLLPNFVRLLAYLGAIALMAGAHFSKSPKVMGAITPVHQGWIDIRRPFAAFALCWRTFREIDAKTYKLKVGGDGAAAPIELTLDDLKNAGVRSGGRRLVAFSWRGDCRRSM